MKEAGQELDSYSLVHHDSEYGYHCSCDRKPLDGFETWVVAGNMLRSR
jgi:hypothetical protein